MKPSNIDAEGQRELAMLDAVERDQHITQRSLSAKLGIALGLTNLLVKRIVTKGWIKVTHLKANRVAYLITPAGIAEKARLTNAYIESTIHLYTETRALIRESLDRLSAGWPAEDLDENGRKRIVFYGTGEVAEIAYISLQETDLQLVGVVDDKPRKPFLGFPVHSPDLLKPESLNGEPFGRLVVVALRKTEAIRRRLKDAQFPMERVHFLESDASASHGSDTVRTSDVAATSDST